LGVRRARKNFDPGIEAPPLWGTLISALPVGAVDFASPEKVYADSEPNSCHENGDYDGVPDIAGRALYQVADTGCEPGWQPRRNRAQIRKQRKRKQEGDCPSDHPKNAAEHAAEEQDDARDEAQPDGLEAVSPGDRTAARAQRVRPRWSILRP
jgi:hypothetical protein